MKKRAATLKIVERLEDIPEFHDEAEEHLYWAEHELSDALWEVATTLEPGELPDPRSKRKRKAG